MQIQVLLFGITRDIVGENMLSLTIADEITVNKLKQQLGNIYLDLNNYKYSIAVNETYAKGTTKLKDNDTIALIPPVSGG